MKALLFTVGGFLALDGGTTVLLLLLWAATGHVPDFFELSVYGALSIAMVLLKTVVGGLAAWQLFQLENRGRFLAAVVVTYNALFTLGTMLRSGETSAVAWATVAVNAGALLVVLLPAAREACEKPRRTVPAKRISRPPRAVNR